MKMRISLLFIAFASIVFVSCSNKLIHLENGKKIDSRLVGTWIGSEKDKQLAGSEKSWEMIRKADGTFSLDFKVINNGKTYKFIETGTWWIAKGKFHEFHKESGKTDIYAYKVLNANSIQFTAEQISVEMNAESYVFIDTRK
jgi:hypothetical protein